MSQVSPASRVRDNTLLIRPSRGLASLNLRDLWVFRELVYFLTWRDLKVRYKQTVLGAAWAVIQPIVQMVIFTLLFNRAAGFSSEGIPYPIFNFAALLPWGLFAKALNDAGRSLVNNRNMITKVYFPRLVIPVASTLAGAVDFAIAFLVFTGIVVYYHFAPQENFDFTWRISLLTLPLFLLLAFISALGVSLWFSAMNVLYRDVGHVLPFLTQVWFFITPIVYSSTEVAEQWRWLYALNPMTGVVEGFRWALLGSQSDIGLSLAISAAVALVVLVTGLFYFRNMERIFADEI